MAPSGDIHDYERRYNTQIGVIESSQELSTVNRKLILDFDRACHLEGLSLPRKIKLVNALYNLVIQYLKKDFSAATKEDIQSAVIQIDKRKDYSPWTKQSYRVILKKFYSWLMYGDEYKHQIRIDGYPKLVSWINTNLDRKHQPKVQASELLTEDELDRLIKAAEHPRDKAFVSMLYELGARIGELGMLEVRHVTKDKYGYLVDLNGKTGRRTPRIVFSAPYLTAWLNAHPLKNEPKASLWIRKGKRDRVQKMRYGALRTLIMRLADKAGTGKRIYPHLFRHTRVTHLLINRQISEAQAKVFFGWTPSSDMLAEYSHLVSSDVNDTILEIYGIKKGEGKEQKMMPKQCPMCKTVNAADAMFCHHCANVLDVKTAIAIDEKRRQYDQLIAAFLKDPDAQEFFAKKARELGLWDKLRQTDA